MTPDEFSMIKANDAAYERGFVPPDFECAGALYRLGYAARMLQYLYERRQTFAVTTGRRQVEIGSDNAARDVLDGAFRPWDIPAEMLPTLQDVLLLAGLKPKER